MNNTTYDFRLKDSLIGLQFLFVAFGALVLVPILTGLDSNVAFFTAGVGTLLFQFINRSEIPPIFLGSSFAFIAPIVYGVQKWGIAGTMSGLVAAGIFYIVLSVFIRVRGSEILHKILPPVVVGPVVMTIGLILSPVAVNMAMGKSGDGISILVPFESAIVVAFCTLSVTVLVMLLGKKIFRLLPILCGITVGYSMSVWFGIVDFEKITKASWFALPSFVVPKFNAEAIIYILPIAIAPAIEHIGDMLAISNVTNKDYIKNPGLKNTLLGDGVATSFASLLGGPPNTTYSEVTGAVSITKAYNPAIMTWAAIFAIILAFVGKLGAALSSIPVPVMGGILLLLFGTITCVGIETLIKEKVDMSEPRNMIIVSIILVFAVGGMTFNFGMVAFSGIGLGAIIGIILNLFLPKTKHFEGF